MIRRTAGVAALVAMLTLACKGDKGDKGDPGEPGTQGAIGPPGFGWTDAGTHLVTVNAGDVGIGTNPPAAKLDVNGSVNATGYQYQGTVAFGLERGGMITEVARGKPVVVTAGTTLQEGGPTNEATQGSTWRTNVFPSTMTVDLGRDFYFLQQVTWESYLRTDSPWVPEWQGPGAYTLEYSVDASTWTQVSPVPPVAGDFFVHTFNPGIEARYFRLTVKAPATPGNEVHVALFRVLTFLEGDNSAVDARRLYVPQGMGPLRLWGQGRPGVVRYGTSGIETGLCTNAGVRFGLSNARVYWEGAEVACPAGTWVCTLAERGSAACDTPRPDGTCDYIGRDGVCGDTAPGAHWGHVADGNNAGGPEGRHVNEPGSSGGGGNGNYSMPVWCCSY